MGEHFIEKCVCGIVVAQCRCSAGLGEHKTVRIVPCNHPDPPVANTLTDDAVEWMQAPMGPLTSEPMTDARREPVTREEYAIARGRGYYDQLEDAYFALANRLAGVERERDEAIIKYTGQVDAAERARNTALARLEQARQQLSDAQATMARLESVIAKQQFSIEDLSKEHAKQANYRVQAEQQVARLRGVLTDIANTPHGNDHLHTLIAVENMAEQALRETGA